MIYVIMSLIINGIVLLLMIFCICRIFFNSNPIVVEHPLMSGVRCRLTSTYSFLLFSVATAMIFIGPFSLVKYALWTIVLVCLFCGTWKKKVDWIVGAYLIFLIWNLLALTYSSELFQGWMMMIKYTLPLLYLWMAYNAVSDDADFVYFLKFTVITMIVYTFLIGGYAAKLYGFVYAFLNFYSGGLTVSYAAFADFLSALFPVPLALYVLTGKKKWLWAALFFLGSSVLEVVRTGMGAVFIAAAFFCLMYYRIKAIPWIIGAAFVCATLALGIPSVRDKLFMDKSKATTSIAQVSSDNIQMNGRSALWEKNMNRFYEPNKIAGAGLGMAPAYTKTFKSLRMIHSDYVQILCDTGLVGLVLFAFFFIVTMFKVIGITWQRNRYSIFVRVSGAMAVGSCSATFFAMAFDNVVAYSQQCFVWPFVFIGMFLKLVDIENQSA